MANICIGQILDRSKFSWVCSRSSLILATPCDGPPALHLPAPDPPEVDPPCLGLSCAGPCVVPRTRSHSACSSVAVVCQSLFVKVGLAGEAGHVVRLSQPRPLSAQESVAAQPRLGRDLMQLLMLIVQIRQLHDELFWLHQSLPPETTLFGGSSLKRRNHAQCRTLTQRQPGNQHSSATLLCVRCELFPTLVTSQMSYPLKLVTLPGVSLAVYTRRGRTCTRCISVTAVALSAVTPVVPNASQASV